jgi:uncharacterized phage-associated protein
MEAPMLQTYSASQIARYFLSITDPEDNDFSNLKLQKLCYYAQGLCSAMRGKALFNERIEAWDHGPVVPALYHDYKQYGSQPIPVVEDFDEDEIAENDRKALTAVYDYYAQFSAWRLRNMTHAEAPWADAYNSASKHISVDSLVDYFSQQVDDNYAQKLYGEGLLSKIRSTIGLRS